VKLRFWGVRGSIPSPGARTLHFGGNTSCVELRSGSQIVILDAGTGIRPLGALLSREFSGKSIRVTLLITHTHWDHIQGLPFFSPAWKADNELTILGFEGAQSGLDAILSAQMESPYFPVGLNEMPGNLIIKEVWEQKFQVGDLSVHAFPVNHPGNCMAYRLFSGDGSMVFMPDFEPWSRFQADATEPMDPRDAELCDFLRGADSLVCDSQYLPEEYDSHIGWGHSCVDDVVRLAARSGVKHLFLFHHDPDHDDDTIRRKLARAREILSQENSPMTIEAAREGESWDVITGELIAS
jgi:phosphoribosyl 1,2-cyclic phosphodiesterase